MALILLGKPWFIVRIQ